MIEIAAVPPIMDVDMAPDEVGFVTGHIAKNRIQSVRQKFQTAQDIRHFDPVPVVFAGGTPMIEIAAMPPIMDVGIQQKLAKIDVATLGHGDGYRFAHRSIQGLNKNHHIVGRAVTVFLVGRDSGVLHHAIGLCRPRDVLVIQAGDDVHACLGGGVGFAAKTQGIAGAVIDGPATDILELEQHDFPVWCRGVSPPYHSV